MEDDSIMIYRDLAGVSYTRVMRRGSTIEWDQDIYIYSFRRRGGGVFCINTFVLLFIIPACYCDIVWFKYLQISFSHPPPACRTNLTLLHLRTNSCCDFLSCLVWSRLYSSYKLFWGTVHSR